MSIELGLHSENELRDSGLGCGSRKAGSEPVELLRRLLSDPSGKESRGESEMKRPGSVYLVEGLPPLPRRTVDRIGEGEFVEFTDFPVFDGGRREGEWRAELSEKEGSPGGRQSAEARRKGPREVPDISWWGTCFTLFERALLDQKPEMAKQLAGYREAIVEMARKYRWEGVARYDRCFRLAAAGKRDTQWDRVDAALLLREAAGPAGAGISKGAGASSGKGPLTGMNGPGVKRERRQQGHCFRFNKQNGVCVFGLQCRFAHTCSSCGGEHPATQCPSRATGKGPKEGAGFLTGKAV